MELPLTNDFRKIVLQDIPLIDLRAPVEFVGGSFPNSVNLPLMNDDERHQVGLCYKEKGNAEAVKLGHQLVSGENKAERVAAWVAQLQNAPESLLFCFRGGMRSQISQQWVSEAMGSAVARLEGGYKEFRRYLIDQLDPKHLRSRPIVLGGRTGVGKTLLLHKLENALDLEKIAHHRGSSFGHFSTPQPCQINFEHRLAWALIKHSAAGHRNMVVEDEGRNVGDRYLPKPLVAHFDAAEFVVLERTLEERVQVTFDEYISASQAEYCAAYGQDEGGERWLSYMSKSIDRIRRRLGGLRHTEMQELLLNAHRGDDLEAHKLWIRKMLRDYYDPMYDYQMEKNQHRFIFKGSFDEVLAYLQNLG